MVSMIKETQVLGIIYFTMIFKFPGGGGDLILATTLTFALTAPVCL